MYVAKFDIMDQSEEIIRPFALSTTEVSRDARYICVVASESCPMPSLITLRGMPLAFAAEAQECLATYIVSGMSTPIIAAIIILSIKICIRSN